MPNPLDEMPAIDKRVFVVQRAEAELGMMLGELIERHDLTYGEVLQILAGKSVLS